LNHWQQGQLFGNTIQSAKKLLGWFGVDSNKVVAEIYWRMAGDLNAALLAALRPARQGRNFS